MILDSLVISVALSLLAGGRLAHLARVRMRATWLVFVAVILQYGGQWLYARGASWIGGTPLVYLASLAAVIAFIALNRTLPGFVLAGVGVLCNVAVIAANGGRMPVALDALTRAGLEALQAPLESGAAFTHAPLTPDTRLSWLADIFALKPPYPRPKVLSFGDIILALGIANFVAATLQPWPFRRSSGPQAADKLQAG